MTAAGLPGDFVSIPLTVVALKIGDKTIYQIIPTMRYIEYATGAGSTEPWAAWTQVHYTCMDVSIVISAMSVC